MKPTGCAFPLIGVSLIVLGFILSIPISDTDLSGVFIMIVGFIMIGLAYILGVREKNSLEIEKKDNLIRMLNSQTDYTPTQKFVSLDNKYILSVDENSKRLTITSANKNKIFYYRDIWFYTIKCA